MMTKITGSELTLWRKSLGWTRRKAADELNTPFWTYRTWERRKTALPGVVAVAVHLLTGSHKKGIGQGAGRTNGKSLVS